MTLKLHIPVFLARFFGRKTSDVLSARIDAKIDSLLNSGVALDARGKPKGCPTCKTVMQFVRMTQKIRFNSCPKCGYEEYL